MAQPTGQVAGQIQEQDAVLLGHLLEQVVKSGRSHADHHGRAGGFSRCGTGQRFQDAHFPKELSRSKHRQLHGGRAIAVLDDADLAGLDQIHAVVDFSFPRKK
jgi:hypothetical protein